MKEDKHEQHRTINMKYNETNENVKVKVEISWDLPHYYTINLSIRYSYQDKNN